MKTVFLHLDLCWNGTTFHISQENVNSKQNLTKSTLKH